MGHQTFELDEHQVRRRINELEKLDGFITSYRHYTVAVLLFNSELYVGGGVAAPLGNLYVYDLSGVFQRAWTVLNITNLTEHGGEIYVSIVTGTVAVYNTSGTLQRSWGVGGTAVWGIAALSGEIYVSVGSVPLIKVYDTSGVLQRSWTPGSLPGAITIMDSEVYVALRSLDDIEVYNTTGTLQRTITAGETVYSSSRGRWLDNDGTRIASSSQGSSPSVVIYEPDGTVLGKIDALPKYGCAFSADGSSLYLAGPTISPASFAFVDRYNALLGSHQIPVLAT